jgi:hypothetical protein
MKETAYYYGGDQYPDLENLMKWDNVIIAGVFDQRLLAFRDREGRLACWTRREPTISGREYLIFLGPDTWSHALVPAYVVSQEYSTSMSSSGMIHWSCIGFAILNLSHSYLPSSKVSLS